MDRIQASLTDANTHWEEFYSSEGQVHLLKAKIHEKKLPFNCKRKF